jgi:16S rRNA (adenine1518-N6/adenine1519-N6)-dimethyltransferase
MSNSSEIPQLNSAALLHQYGLRPKKSLGQNFLQDPAALESIVKAAEIEPDDSVLEVGPGLGSLTRYLAIHAREVVAVELDQRLLPLLQAILSPYANVRLIQADILKVSPAELMSKDGYLVVANIPYYITSALLRHLLESHPRPRRMVLTVQKEVAERICAESGRMSLLSLSVQVYGRPRIIARIPAGAFYPAPKIDSAILRIEIAGEPGIPYELLDKFFQLAKAGFGQKRKTLRNSISAGLRITPTQAQSLLEAAGIDAQRRAETLSLDEWKTLTKIIK